MNRGTLRANHERPVVVHFLARRSVALVTGGLLTCSLVTGPASAGQSSATWNAAIEVSGTATLNIGGQAQVDSISCSSAGQCSATGHYTIANSVVLPFVVNETGGVWGSAEEIPGIATLATGSGANTTVAISCPSAGNCAVGGSYTDSSNLMHPFVVSESNGTWGTATEVPGFVNGATNNLGAVTDISCTAIGDCTAGGFYGATGSNVQTFVTTETGGTWSNAIEIPGTAALNVAGKAFVTSISCTSPGNCGATGVISPVAQQLETFVASESSGTWASAIAIPDLTSYTVGVSAIPSQISCSSPGNCSVGGDYSMSATEDQAFIVSETNATWGAEMEPPGTATLNAGQGALITSISCPSNGNCAAGGTYSDASGNPHAFVVSESAGSWGNATDVPGTTALNASGVAAVLSVSCSAAGTCAAGGVYTDATNQIQAFVTNESGGAWSTGLEVPGTASLNTGGNAGVVSISCTWDGSCGAAGSYADSSTTFQAFVLDSAATVTAPAAATIEVKSPAKGEVKISLSGAVNNGGTPIRSYQYSINGGAWTTTGSATSRSFVIRHLTSKRTYHVELRANNRFGNGAASRNAVIKVK